MKGHCSRLSHIVHKVDCEYHFTMCLLMIKLYSETQVSVPKTQSMI